MKNLLTLLYKPDTIVAILAYGPFVCPTCLLKNEKKSKLTPSLTGENKPALSFAQTLHAIL